MENLLYFHLGHSEINWNGKIKNFDDDINIQLIDLYYNCEVKCKNIYYNELNKIINTINTINKTNLNIYDDIWTCSDEMRDDIKDFFSFNSNLKIGEIGSHKGYTTNVLSSIFSKVYAIDNNVEFTKLNQKYNKDKTNIEYIILDLYKDQWTKIDKITSNIQDEITYNKLISSDINVVFIDAIHSYDHCKSDIFNSLIHFTNLEYIIFDDYGAWSGVKQIVDELIMNQILIFEKFIGINNVPSNNGIIKYTYEGIICSINKNIKLKYINYYSKQNISGSELKLNKNRLLLLKQYKKKY